MPRRSSARLVKNHARDAQRNAELANFYAHRAEYNVDRAQYYGHKMSQKQANECQEFVDKTKKPSKKAMKACLDGGRVDMAGTFTPHLSYYGQVPEFKPPQSVEEAIAKFDSQVERATKAGKPEIVLDVYKKYYNMLDCNSQASENQRATIKNYPTMTSKDKEDKFENYKLAERAQVICEPGQGGKLGKKPFTPEWAKFYSCASHKVNGESINKFNHMKGCKQIMGIE